MYEDAGIAVLYDFAVQRGNFYHEDYIFTNSG